MDHSITIAFDLGDDRFEVEVSFSIEVQDNRFDHEFGTHNPGDTYEFEIIDIDPEAKDEDGSTVAFLETEDFYNFIAERFDDPSLESTKLRIAEDHIAYETEL